MRTPSTSPTTRLQIVGAVLAATFVIAPGAVLAKGRRPASRPSATPVAAAPVAAAPDAKADETFDDVPPIQGQAPNPPQDPSTTPNNQLTAASPLITFVDVPATRVGVDQSNVLSLTMHDAIKMAVAKNLSIEISKFDVRSSEYDLISAKGGYDPLLAADIGFTSATFPVTSLFQGGGTDASVTQKELAFNASFQRLLESGGNFKATFNNTRETTDSTASTLNPIYRPTLTFDISQPLMRNFKIDSTRRQIKLAKKQLDLTDVQFRQQVIDTITSVQRAYWDLVYALRNEQIQRESVELARVQLENNLRQVEAGTLAPIELRSTESNLELRKEFVITALQAITTAENTLKNLMFNDPGDPMWSARITPVDPAGLVPIGADLDSSMKAAVLNRPELTQLKLRTELKQIDREFFKNQLKPQVDAFFQYSLRGTAGSPAFSTDNPVFVPDQFIGGYGRSIGTLFSADFPTYSVGVRFSFPIGNNVAEANFGRTEAELRQLDAEQRRMVQSIQVEVRNALQSVDAARQRFEAAKASRVAAEAQLRGEEERFRAGLSTNFFVLDRQNQLSEARGREAQALTDYNKAIVELQRVTGTTDSVNGVTIESKAE